jgi:hypothetical protein
MRDPPGRKLPGQAAQPAGAHVVLDVARRQHERLLVGLAGLVEALGLQRRSPSSAYGCAMLGSAAMACSSAKRARSAWLIWRLASQPDEMRGPARAGLSRRRAAGR